MTKLKTIRQVCDEFREQFPELWLVHHGDRLDYLYMAIGYSEKLPQELWDRLTEWCAKYGTKYCDSLVTNEDPYSYAVSIRIPEDYLRHPTPLETAIVKIKNLNLTSEEKRALVEYEPPRKSD